MSTYRTAEGGWEHASLGHNGYRRSVPYQNRLLHSLAPDPLVSGLVANRKAAEARRATADASELRAIAYKLANGGRLTPAQAVLMKRAVHAKSVYAPMPTTVVGWRARFAERERKHAADLRAINARVNRPRSSHEWRARLHAVELDLMRTRLERQRAGR